MSIIWSDRADKILSIGVPMPHGIENWALTREQALIVMDQFLEAQIAVLGGDVCPEVNGRIYPNGDTWYCEKGVVEDDRAFLIRSIEESRKYIQNYPSLCSEKLYFNLVPDIRT